MSVKFGTGECKPTQAGQNEAKQQVDSWGQAKNKTKNNFKCDGVIGPRYASEPLGSAWVGLDSPVQRLTLTYHTISIKMLIEEKKTI